MRLIALTVALVALTGCAVRNTPAQDLALERWEQCKGKFPTIGLKEIRPDGQIWYSYRGASDRAAVEECLRNAARAQSAAVRPPAQISSVVSPAVAVAPDLFPANAPTWRQGFEWVYRYESPDDKGTFVWTVDREEEVDGALYWVIKAGTSELFFRMRDLAWRHSTDGGVVIVKHDPPRLNFLWPLTPGSSWEQRFRTESPEDGHTNDERRRWRVEPEETVDVPAGVFRAVKISQRETLTGRLISDVWYSPEVMNWVKAHEVLPSGVRDRELISYKIR